MTSQMSAKLTVLDIPEVKSFNASFIYNFFTFDESVNSTPQLHKNVAEISVDSFSESALNGINAIVPRYIKFNFSLSFLNNGNKSPYIDVEHQNISIINNYENIYAEEQLCGLSYSAFEFQDDNIDKKLYTYVSGTIAKRVAAKNRAIQSNIDQNTQTLLNVLPTDIGLAESARILAEDTSQFVKNDVIVKAITQIEQLNTLFIDEQAQKAQIDKTFELVKNVSVKSQVLNKIVGDVVSNVVNDPMSNFADEFAVIRQRAITKQTEAVNNSNPNVIKKEEIAMPTIVSIEQKALDKFEFASHAKIVGYIIEKSEVLQDGQLLKHKPIIIENPLTTTAVDFNVAYGKTYIYTIRTVAKISVRTISDELDGTYLTTGLVKSRKSYRVSVTCVENIPPPVVYDINAVWDSFSKNALILWSMPPNKQRDVKRFQVFKRYSINEPFQLLKEIDFDDSIIKFSSNETPDPALVEKVQLPVTSYVDTEFSIETSSIYAVCAIDAHGLSSGYSTQINVSFDKFKNKLKTNVIAFSGAPKSYPNLTLNDDLFDDVIKTSEKTRAKIYFDPDYLFVNDSQGNDLRFLATNKVDRTALYRMQMINIDLQRQEVVNIHLRDVQKTIKAGSSTNRQRKLSRGVNK